MAGHGKEVYRWIRVVYFCLCNCVMVKLRKLKNESW